MSQKSPPRLCYVLEYPTHTRPPLPVEPQTFTRGSEPSVTFEEGSYYVSWTLGNQNHERAFTSALRTLEQRLGTRALTNLNLVARIDADNNRQDVSTTVKEAYMAAHAIATGKFG